MTLERTIQPGSHELYFEALKTMPLAADGYAYESGDAFFLADGFDYPAEELRTTEQKKRFMAECKRRNIISRSQLFLEYDSHNYFPKLVPEVPDMANEYDMDDVMREFLPFKLHSEVAAILGGGRKQFIRVTIGTTEHARRLFHHSLLPELVNKGYQVDGATLHLFAHAGGTNPTEG